MVDGGGVMRKLIKTIILIPMYPLILASMLEPKEWEYDMGTCRGRGTAMLRWRKR